MLLEMAHTAYLWLAAHEVLFADLNAIVAEPFRQATRQFSRLAAPLSEPPNDNIDG